MLGVVVSTLLWMCGLGNVHAGTVTYVYTDPQGTPLAEADASGNITARFEYTPYGVSVSSMGVAPNGVGYTGHVNDPESGLVYMQARYYDAAVGRFLSVDPVGPSPGDGFNFNRYNYVENDPINKIDPDGRCPVCVIPACAATPCGAIVAAGAAALAVATINAIHETKGYLEQESRSKPPPPLPEAEGKPHSIPDGKGGYTSYPDGKPTTGKQYRPDGKPHGDIPRPNVKEWEPNPQNPNGTGGSTVRPPRPDEIPSTPTPAPIPKSAPPPKASFEIN